MQEELGWTRSSLRKCIRPLVENGLRAHDDDPRVPVLVNRRGHERPVFQHRFSGTPFDCSFVLSVLLQTSGKRTSKSLRLAGKREGRHRVMVFSARQHRPTDPSQLVCCGNNHDIARGSAFQTLHPLSEIRSFAFGAQHHSSGSVDEHLAQIGIPPFTDPQQLCLASGGPLSRYQPQPRRKLSSLVKGGTVSDGRYDRGSNQGPPLLGSAAAEHRLHRYARSARDLRASSRSAQRKSNRRRRIFQNLRHLPAQQECSNLIDHAGRPSNRVSDSSAISSARIWSRLRSGHDDA